MTKLHTCILASVMSYSCYASFECSPENWTTSSAYRGFGKWDDFEFWVPLNDDWRVKVRGKKDYSKDMYLSVGGQLFYIYSNMDDDAQFNDHELNFEFIDLNGDGALDLLITGSINYTGKVDFEIYEQEDIVFIYLCNLGEEKFELKFKKASFDLEVKDSVSDQWWKRYKSTDVLDSDRYAELRDLDEEKSKGTVTVQRKWHYSSELASVSKAEAKELVKAANQPSEPGIVKNIYLNEGENTNSSSRDAEGGSGSEEINP